MMAYITSSKVGIEVLGILGLPSENCQSFRIDFEPESLPVVTVRYFAEREQLIEVANLISGSAADA